MTMEEIKASDKEFLTPKDVAPVLGTDAYSINIQTRDDPSKLGFRVIKIGSRVKIPRKAFIDFMESCSEAGIIYKLLKELRTISERLDALQEEKTA